MKTYSKLKNGPMMEEDFGKKEYISKLYLENARQTFKFRSKMFDSKLNYKSNKKYAEELWKCDSCQISIESQEHVLFCPAYTKLREGKDLSSDEDLSEYLKKVLKVREKLKLVK